MDDVAGAHDDSKWHIESFKDYPLSDKTVVRISHKISNGLHYIDVRLWGVSRVQKLYPTHKGVCLNQKFWHGIVKVMGENGMLIPPTSTDTIDGQE